MNQPLPISRRAIRVVVASFSIALLAGYVTLEHQARSRRIARGTKSTAVLQDLRLIDGSSQQSAGPSPNAGAVAQEIEQELFDARINKMLMFSTKSAPVFRENDLPGLKIRRTYTPPAPEEFFAVPRRETRGRTTFYFDK